MLVVDRTCVPNTGAAKPVIIGESDRLKQVVLMAERLACGTAKVLITGESGSGKDLIAQLIHASSRRNDQRFVALNCASVSDSLLESELFGHVKGSFTGAYRDKVGKLRLADRGTIFLDEIGEMSLRMQATLLRFLENGEIQPVGSDTPPIRVDVRVISATNRDLTAMVARGEFREDLLYRIRIAHLHVPPLRERPSDIRPLVTHIVERTGQQVRVSESAMQVLESYRWPGNVRELQNVVEQMLAMTDAHEVGIEQLPPAVACDSTALKPSGERRRRVSDDLYERLTSGSTRFFEDIYPAFMERDLTRGDIRQLVGKGLSTTGGNYRGLLRLFGVPDDQYKRFLNFLASHDCNIDFRPYRSPERVSLPVSTSAHRG